MRIKYSTDPLSEYNPIAWGERDIPTSGFSYTYVNYFPTEQELKEHAKMDKLSEQEQKDLWVFYNQIKNQNAYGLETEKKYLIETWELNPYGDAEIEMQKVASIMKLYNSVDSHDKPIRPYIDPVEGAAFLLQKVKKEKERLRKEKNDFINKVKERLWKY